MYAPRVRQGIHVPSSLYPFVLGTAAVVAVVVAWAAFMARPTSNDASRSLPAVDPSTVRSVAYVLPGPGSPGGQLDRVFVRPLDGTAEPVEIASFRYAFNFHLAGATSPAGDRVAILHVDNSFARAHLAFLQVPGGERTDVEGDFEYGSALAWRPDGRAVAGVAHRSANAAKPSYTILEASIDGGAAQAIARFDGVEFAEPIGYSLDGNRLFIVVLDQGGSSLWQRLANGRLERLRYFSTGPTRSWILSPDASRLAYVDRVGTGERSYAGKTLVIATGQVTETGAHADQLGAAWRPGSGVPDFGGPGGTLRLTDDAAGSYVVPLDWSPDGTTLVATVFSDAGTQGAPVESVEIQTATSRVRLAEEGDARFLGFARSGR